MGFALVGVFGLVGLPAEAYLEAQDLRLDQVEGVAVDLDEALALLLVPFVSSPFRPMYCMKYD